MLLTFCKLYLQPDRLSPLSLIAARVQPSPAIHPQRGGLCKRDNAAVRRRGAGDLRLLL